MNNTFVSLRCASATMSSAVPIGRGSTRRVFSSRQRYAATTATATAAVTHGHGPSQNLRVGSPFTAAETSRAALRCHGRSAWIRVMMRGRAGIDRASESLASLSSPARDRLAVLRSVGSARDACGRPRTFRVTSGVARAAARVDRGAPRRSRSPPPLCDGAHQTGDRDLAIWPLKRAMDARLAQAGRPAARGAVARSGAHGEAIAICDRILEAEPDDVPTLIARANARDALARGTTRAASPTPSARSSSIRRTPLR